MGHSYWQSGSPACEQFNTSLSRIPERKKTVEEYRILPKDTTDVTWLTSNSRPRSSKSSALPISLRSSRYLGHECSSTSAMGGAFRDDSNNGCIWDNVTYLSLRMTRTEIGHFRVILCLSFKTSLREKPFITKGAWFALKWSCRRNSF